MRDEPGIPDQLRIKFPHLKPIKSPPSLATVNGIGLSVFGKRDLDAETNTYVKTRCFCFLFVPLIAIDAYRVADAGSRRWYFLGKDSLSTFARSWNMAMGCLAIFLALAGAWGAYTDSPEYRAKQDIKRAAAFMQNGEPIKAAGLYRQHLFGPSADEGRAGFKNAIETALDSDKPDQATAALRMVMGLPLDANQPAPLVPDASAKGLADAQKFRTTNPVAALGILDATVPLDPQNPAVPSLQVDILKQILAANPTDVDHAVQLALIYEKNGQLNDAVALLRPLKAKLGATEGARILGQKLLQEQNYQDAYGLLFPYVQTRLQQLHQIESSYTNILASISHRAINDLNDGRGSPEFYANYKVASKEQQETMVDDFIEQRTKADPAYQKALESLKTGNKIVPVTLDLGVVQLNRAQELKDPDQRKAELEAAEKTFLAIRSFAGETDEYRLFLGQVYYWLGRSEEGHALFDQLLASRKRDFDILMEISQTLRSVGAETEARSLSEEAYRSASTDTERYEAAAVRALICKDDDDRLSWLEKADPSATWVQVELDASRGQKALSAGNKRQAADYLSKAIQGYEAEPKTSASLNNCGLAYFALYEATGSMGDEEKGLSSLEEAISLDPGDSILLHNTVYFLIGLAARNVNHDTIDLSAIDEQPGMQLLPYLYRDEAGRAKVYQQLHNDDAMRKALGYLDKAMLLAPKNCDLYLTALTLQSGFRDLNEVQKIKERFDRASPDVTENRQAVLDVLSGKKDQKTLESYQKHIQTMNGYLTNALVRGDPATADFVISRLIELQLGASRYGVPVDAHTMLQQAAGNYQRHPSSSSHSTLRAAYFFQASTELAQQDPDYNAMVARTRRVLTPEILLALVLERGGPLAEKVQKNENFSHGMALVKEDMTNFPAWTEVSDWALLKNTAPDMAAQAAETIKANQLLGICYELSTRMDPLDCSTVLGQYWRQKMLGNDSQATQIYNNAIHDGLPLPAL